MRFNIFNLSDWRLKFAECILKLYRIYYLVDLNHLTYDLWSFVFSKRVCCKDPNIWRKMWDSNPRNPFEVDGLANRSINRSGNLPSFYIKW